MTHQPIKDDKSNEYRPTKRPHITNHHQEFRVDVGIDCSSPILTDQSYKNACDINFIMAQYAKTGMFPHLNLSEPQYLDNTLIPNLEDAFTIARMASDMFYELPPTIRKLMDNDPAQLEKFIADPENTDILLKHGLFIKKEDSIVVEPKPLADPPPVG